MAGGAGAPGGVTEVLGLAPVSEEGLMVPANKKKYEENSHHQASLYHCQKGKYKKGLSPVADPDGDSAAEVPIVTLADTWAADSEAVTDTAVLLLHPAEVTAVLQLDPAEVTDAASVGADF